MKKNRLILLFPLFLVVASIIGTIRCTKLYGTTIPPTAELHKQTNAVYYWRTVFKLSDKERDFLQREKIGRIYLRMFDVTADISMAVPNATVTFGSAVPQDVEIVPTIFITVEALKQTAEANELGALAEKIVKRVKAMCSWNDIENWKEIQLDCDWTESTRDAFYILCKEVKARSEGKLLSSTIRLHQLTQKAPPVDYGVLMVYNTDRFDDYLTNNSILNNKTVEEYLNKKMEFNLPLDVALPIFQWDIVFRDKQFVRIAKYYEDLDDAETIRHEQVPIEELKETQRLLTKFLRIKSGQHSIILYHLDSANINNYRHEDIKSIYNN